MGYIIARRPDKDQWRIDFCPTELVRRYYTHPRDFREATCECEFGFLDCTSSQVTLIGGQKSTPLLLWIDALCINQDDLQERSHQVQMMKQIYSRASSVLVWLGLHRDDSILVLATAWLQQIDEDGRMEMLRYDLFENPDFSLIASTHTLHDPRYTSIDPALFGLETFPSTVEDLRNLRRRLRHAMISLMSRSYWQRLWVVQEVLLAKEVQIMCGEDLMTWNKLATYLEAQYNTGPSTDFPALILKAASPPDPGSERISSAYDMPESNSLVGQLRSRCSTPEYDDSSDSPTSLEARSALFHALELTPGLELMKARAAWDPKGVSLLTAIFQWASKQCGDPRDKVYALRGIADNDYDVLLQTMVANYAEGPEQLYKFVIQSCFMNYPDKDWLPGRDILLQWNQSYSRPFPDELAAVLNVSVRHPLIAAMLRSLRSRMIPGFNIEQNEDEVDDRSNADRPNKITRVASSGSSEARKRESDACRMIILGMQRK